MKKIVLLAILLTSGCTDPDGAKFVLESQGFTNVKTHGYAWFGCGQDDTFATKFTAQKNNKNISGVACSGFFKGTTIRFK